MNMPRGMALSCMNGLQHDMPKNTGTQPPETRGKNVRVRFRNGHDSANYTPPHWPADTLRWDIAEHPCDIAFWKLAD